MSAGGWLLVLGAGLIGGFVNAIAGGGSLLLFPALVASGLGSVAANVTNSVALWPGYAGNLAALGEDARPRRRQASLLGVAAAGAVGGCVLLLVTPASAFSVVVPFLVIAAALLLAAQPRLRTWLGEQPAHGRPVQLHVGVFAGAVYGGYFGGGLGVILMALIGLTLVAPIREVNGLKGLLQLLIASVTLAVFALFGPVHWTVALAVAPVSLLGGVAGGHLARRLSEPVLRWCVVGFGLAVGVWLAVRAFG